MQRSRGPVTVSFATQFFTIGTPGQTHLHVSLDGDLAPYRFYDGPAITADTGVLYTGGLLSMMLGADG